MFAHQITELTGPGARRGSTPPDVATTRPLFVHRIGTGGVLLGLSMGSSRCGSGRGIWSLTPRQLASASGRKVPLGIVNGDG
jgi:hypothetical protein